VADPEWVPAAGPDEVAASAGEAGWRSSVGDAAPRAAAAEARDQDEEDEEEEAGGEVEVDALGRPIVPAWIDEAEPEDLALAVEAVCFILNRPVTVAELSGIVGRSAQAVTRAVESLATQLRGRGLMLQRHRDEVQLVTRPQVAWAAQRAINPERPARLSRPALETLAIVAYRQPVTRAAVESIRGVNCEAVLDSLERRGLVAEIGRADTPGQPRLFGTTLRFLQLVGLESIHELPPLPAGVSLPPDQEEAWTEALSGGEPAAQVGTAEPAGP
jgi:segregation and condensation protein B